MEHLRPNAVDDSEGDLGPMMGRIDVHTKRSLDERRINNLHDGFSNRPNVGVLGHDGGEGLLDFLCMTFIWPRFLLGHECLVGGHSSSMYHTGTHPKSSLDDV